MQLIESKTLGSAQASIEFTNIPQTFTDLYCVMSLRGDNSANSVEIRFFLNGAGGNDRVLYGFGSGGAGSNSSANLRGVTSANTATTNTFGSGALYIPNYTSAIAKSLSYETLSENNNSVADMYVSAGLSNTTSAITSLTISPVSGNWLQNSMVSLYGITKGSDGTTTVS